MINKVITSILVMLTAWCTWNSACIGKNSKSISNMEIEQAIMLREVAGNSDKIHNHLRNEDLFKEEVPDNTTNE